MSVNLKEVGEKVDKLISEITKEKFDDWLKKDYLLSSTPSGKTGTEVKVGEDLGLVAFLKREDPNFSMFTASNKTYPLIEWMKKMERFAKFYHSQFTKGNEGQTLTEEKLNRLQNAINTIYNEPLTHEEIEKIVEPLHTSQLTPLTVDKEEWISVEERLPENFKKDEYDFYEISEDVLAYCSTFGVQKAYIKKWTKDFYILKKREHKSGEIEWETAIGTHVTNVTHWMPLPKAPKDEQLKNK